jgi:DNA polymerase-3 subunit beta
MQLTTTKRDLLRIAKSMNGIAERKSTMPVLSNVLLTTAGTALRCAATDLYLTLVDNIPAEIARTGSVMVSAKDLADRIATLADGPIEITVKDNALTLKNKGTARRFTLRSSAGDDYPPLPSAEPSSPTFTIEIGTLTRLIHLTAASICDDSTRAHLNSLLIEREGDIIRAVSTDGHRLSKAEVKLDGGGSSAMLIPLKAVNALRAMCDALPVDDKLTIVQSGSSAFFTGGSATLSVKLADATFPPYQQVIPKQSTRTLRLPRAALAEAIKAVSVAANDRTGGIKLSFSKGVLHLSSESPDSGDGADELPYEVIDGKDGAVIGLNARYPIDALNALSCDEVDVGMSAELDPIVIKPVGDGAGEFLNVLMPMRI